MNSHNIKTIIALFGLCMSLSIPTKANANACEFADEAPAKESKTYRNVNAGFSFSMPSNYRVMVDKDGVAVYDPSSYKYNECATRNKTITHGNSASFIVSFTPVRSSKTSLRDLVLQWMEKEGVKKEGVGFRSGNFLGKKSIVFSLYNGIDDLNNNYTAVLSRDRRYLIIIYGPEKDRELRKALATFKLN
jgi:hypothetical protein